MVDGLADLAHGRHKLIVAVVHFALGVERFGHGVERGFERGAAVEQVLAQTAYGRGKRGLHPAGIARQGSFFLQNRGAKVARIRRCGV